MLDPDPSVCAISTTPDLPRDASQGEAPAWFRACSRPWEPGPFAMRDAYGEPEDEPVDALVDRAFVRAGLWAAPDDDSALLGAASPMGAILSWLPPDRADRPYLRRREGFPLAVSPRSLAEFSGYPPLSGLLHGPLSPRERVEGVRADLISACDVALATLETNGAAWVDPYPASWKSVAEGSEDAEDCHREARRQIYWGLTNAATAQALHAAVAEEERPRAARAYRSTADASEIWRAILAAKRLGFPLERLPLAMARKFGRVPGTPIAWALLEIEAGLALASPVDVRDGVAAWERRRSDLWRKRLARARAMLVAANSRKPAAAIEREAVNDRMEVAA